jgi:hypothetical protein
LTIEDALMILAGLACVLGLYATATELISDPHDLGCWYRLMERTIGYSAYNTFILVCSVSCATVLDWVDLVTDILVVIGYAMCGAWGWFTIGVSILVLSTGYIAYNAMQVDTKVRGGVTRFIMAVFQLDMLVEAISSVKEGRKSIHFARSKFLEGLLESCPQAFLSMYVLYSLNAESHFWLIMSTIVSVISLAYGLSEWLEIGVDEDIYLHTYWYHHLVRTCFFTVDFSLRLMTFTLLLEEEEHRPVAVLLLLGVTIMYGLVTSIFTRDMSELSKTFFLTFFINLLPAELRSRAGKERFLFLLDPSLREQLHGPLMLVRSVDFLLLTCMIVYLDNGRHQRRSLCLGTLLVADVLLVWCVRMVTERLAAQHEDLRRSSSIDIDASPVLHRKASV